VEGGLIYSGAGYLDRLIREAEWVFAEMQRAAKIRDWKAFKRLKDDHRNLCAQWQALVS
jgi:hypothetical protein